MAADLTRIAGRVAAILVVLERGEPISVRRLAAEVGIPPTTAHRFLVALAANGRAELTPNGWSWPSPEISFLRLFQSAERFWKSWCSMRAMSATAPPNLELPDGARLLTPREIAKRMGITVDTATKLLDEGRPSRVHHQPALPHKSTSAPPSDTR